jgi:hypothetical protein
MSASDISPHRFPFFFVIFGMKLLENKKVKMTGGRVLLDGMITRHSSCQDTYYHEAL